ncbi:choline-sulfatase [Roseiarcus fermentans]|uniref:Choline-sulfatase n=1 Tax=Roseiarcus fermentans TaxID=1473586 RepID=A0A366EVT0_9HYPH|nr:sulfatase-like hydrolase/transferase [Roseiarcus fermentans]RBP06444.1 choline-sulfatase [Roseiarcus fermentans]
MSDDRTEFKPSRRDLLASGAATILGVDLLHAKPAAAAQASAPDAPPAGYNILFILVDQEHFFPKWPFPVPAREWLRANGVTFSNHQAASCVCSPARSVIYTGAHIQHSGVFDNLNYLWQPDLSTSIKTIGHRMHDLGYHAAYQGKWHLSANLDQTRVAIDAPMADYRKIIGSYGFDDFFGVGDLIDGGLGGFTYDGLTTDRTVSWMRNEGAALRAKGQPWFLAVNFVNPHDVMYIDSDLPGQVVQGRNPAIAIFPTPQDRLYQERWDDLPLPATRSQPLDAPGRPKAHAIYQSIQDMMVGAWPDEDRRWRILRNYYYNCIRDCDQQVMQVLKALKDTDQDQNTIIVFNADHGELGGHHQMRGKGNCAYKEQNHVPLIVRHPAYPGGVTCDALTSQIDLAPTLIALTGLEPSRRAKAAEGLVGRDVSGLLGKGGAAKVDEVRPATLFNYNMLSYQDVAWAEHFVQIMFSRAVTDAEKIQEFLKNDPDFGERVGIRSVFDGRYRFSRYFGQTDFNTPTTMEALLAKNDVELYDLKEDPDEIHNLAMDPVKHGDLLIALNKVANDLIAAEVGLDDGVFLPIRNGKWFFPPPSER